MGWRPLRSFKRDIPKKENRAIKSRPGLKKSAGRGKKHGRLGPLRGITGHLVKRVRKIKEGGEERGREKNS